MAARTTDAEQTITGMHPEWVPPASAGRVALAFGFASPAEVDAMFGQLTQAGHPGPLAPYDAPWGQRYATTLDPDGNIVDLFASGGDHAILEAFRLVAAELDTRIAYLLAGIGAQPDQAA
jgi:hypothetical protein